jgi:hypothetical protein
MREVINFTMISSTQQSFSSSASSLLPLHVSVLRPSSCGTNNNIRQFITLFYSFLLFFFYSNARL